MSRSKRERQSPAVADPPRWESLSQAELVKTLRGLLASGKLSERDVQEAVPGAAPASPEPKAKRPKQKKEFDMSKFRQRYIAMRVLYFGETLRGFASLSADDDDETVEGLLFGALKRLRLIVSRQDCCFSRSGRTDRGVSAFGQVVSLRIRSKAPSTVSLDDPGEPGTPSDHFAAGH